MASIAPIDPRDLPLLKEIESKLFGFDFGNEPSHWREWNCHNGIHGLIYGIHIPNVHLDSENLLFLNSIPHNRGFEVYGSSADTCGVYFAVKMKHFDERVD